MTNYLVSWYLRVVRLVVLRASFFTYLGSLVKDFVVCIISTGHYVCFDFRGLWCCICCNIVSMDGFEYSRLYIRSLDIDLAEVGG